MGGKRDGEEVWPGFQVDDQGDVDGNYVNRDEMSFPLACR